MQDKYEIFAGNALFNIFNGALIPILKRELNQVRDYKVIGYRLESIKSEKVRVFCRMPEDANGVYTATVFFDGIRRRARNKTSAFFPKHWTKREVTEAIYEAYQNKSLRKPIDRQYIGTSENGMNIILWLDKAEKVIDAMPFRDEVIEINRRRKLKSLCNHCHQPKQYVCLEHHSFKKSRTSKFLKNLKKRMRYYSRKVYFNLARKLGLEG